MSRKSSRAAAAAATTAAPAPGPGAARERSFSELGSSGLRRNAGFVMEGFPRNLQGRQAMKLYEEMSGSAIVGAGMVAIKKLIAQVSWSVQPFSQDQEDVARAEFVESGRNDMSFTWAQTMEEHLSMLIYGFAPHEIVYKRRGGDVNDPSYRSKYSDGLIHWRKLPLRGQDTVTEWKLDEHGGIQGLVQMAAPKYSAVAIPIESLLLFRASSEKNNPWGRSAIFNAQWPYYASKKMMEIEGIAVERDMTGLPTMGLPPECFDAQPAPLYAALKAAADRIVQSIKVNESMGVTYPLSYTDQGHERFKLSLMASPGKRSIDVGGIIERYERRILMVLLADFVMMGHEQVGSFALSSDKTALFAVALGGWLDSIAEIYNVYAIPRLMAMNGWPTDRCPRLCHGDIEAPNLAALGDYIAKLYGAGFQWGNDEAVEAHLRRVAGLPKKAVGRAVALYGPDGQLVTPAARSEAMAEKLALKDRGEFYGALIRAGVKPGSAAKVAGLPADMEHLGLAPVTVQPSSKTLVAKTGSAGGTPEEGE